MDPKKDGPVTRSKTHACAVEEPDKSCVTMIPRSEGAKSTVMSRSSRSSREALRLRAEYEAEKEIAKLREELIKKKLALDIAELDVEMEEERPLSVCGNTKVNEWFMQRETSKKSPAPEAVAGPSCSYPNARVIPLATSPPVPLSPPALDALAGASCSCPNARDIPLATAPLAPLSPPAAAASSDLRNLADVILSLKSKQSFELPLFDGNPVEWLSYRKAYETNEHKYSSYENIMRLQTSLRSAAKSAVEDLLRTGSAPEEIIYALEEEFGHPNLLLETAIRKIRDLPRVSDSGSELRRMTSVVRNCVFILKSIKAEGYLNNPQLTHEILGKLTPVQRSQYGEYVMKLNISSRAEDLRISPNLNIVLEFLSYLSKAASYYLPLNTELPRNRNYAVPETSSQRRVIHRVHTTSTSVDLPSEESSCTSEVPSSNVNNVSCLLCNNNHLLPDCRRFIEKSETDKWNFVKANKLCFKCIVAVHPRFRCQATRCAKCGAPHHTLLHYVKSSAAVNISAPRYGAETHGVAVLARDDSALSPTREPASATLTASRSRYDETTPTAATFVARVAESHASPVPVVSAESVTSMGELCTKSLLKVMPVSICVNNTTRECYALLDDGATVSLIDSSLITNVCGPTIPLKIISASGHVVTDNNSCKVTALITGPNGVRHSIALRTIRDIELPSQSVPAGVLAQNIHLKDLDYCTMSCAKPMMLIGQDNWELIVNHEIRQGKSGQPVASLTKLGWVVHGPLSTFPESAPESVNFISEKDDLYELVKQQFELESIGISEVSRKNVESERACKILDNTSRRVDSGWEVGLLWSRDEVHLPDNYDNAIKRLRGVENKMDRDPEYATAYTSQIDRLIAEKYAKLVNGPMSVSPVWWLPHFGVTNPNKPGKLRLVYDAAAKYQGTCLNDYLLSGPDLLNSLLGVLFKFRSGPIAYTADIADMFLRIKIRKEDQGVQLFLWRGKDRSRDPDIYVMDSMIFGAKSSPTSAIYILNKNASEFQDAYPDSVKSIHDKHYMDDYLDSVQSVDEARQLIKEVSKIHAAGGFTIRGWVTNSSELRHELPAVVPGTVNFDKSPNSGERTLGMIWKPESDELAFDLSFKRLPPDIVEGNVTPTKRDFLKFVMSIFDPLGLLCPYTIKSKILLQKVWRSGIGWDEELKESECKEWQRWLEDIKQLSNITVPRWYGLAPVRFDLHVFGDASELGYAAVAFLVGENTSGESTVAMVVGKSRVAPLKVISVPRLELQAAVLACRLASTVVKEQGLLISSRYLWSDSKTVLKWIHSDPRDFQKFVSHRLAEIDQKSKTSEWRWVPSADNPADEATKMHWPTNCKLWFTGPPFLHLSKDQWPVNEYDMTCDSDLERVEKVHVIRQYEPLIKIERFSTWIRAVRATARVLAFVSVCRKKQSEPLTVNNTRDAEAFLIKQSQAETYSEELKLLSAGGVLPVGSKIRDLDPFVYENDGLLRVRGRLSAAPGLMFDEKHPIILDGHSYTAQLIVLDHHRRMHHANHETVINSIREKFWITQLRRTVKSVVSRCQFCRVQRAVPSPPKMGDLPAARLVNTRRAFVNCGIDYFGPMEVAIGRRREKRWGVIFTCLVTRGIHLELAPSLSADSAIMAIRRFVARRGQPSVLFSDQGTNFVSADAELKAALRELKRDELYDFAITNGISWQFNPPAAPHMGGCWERLIRSVKAGLRTALKERVPREEVLITLLAEVEMTINSRPLTYVGTDSDGPVALTPNHLLIGTASGASTLGYFDVSDLSRRRAWKKAQALADMFWRRWLREYVPVLQRRQKWINGVSPLKIGDVVIIVDKNLPRNTWPKGVISAVHPGRDGHIRVVTIKTVRGYFKRPVVKVALLPTDDCCF